MWALIPIKALSGAKQRLSPILSPLQRQQLARAMACDVISRAVASSKLEGVLVISDDPQVESLVLSAGCKFLQESNGSGLNAGGLNTEGLNGAVAQGAEWLRARNVDSMMVIHSDLPLLNTADLNALVSGYPLTPTITIVPDRAGLGSNILICPLDREQETFTFQYGENSLQRHQIEAHRLAIDCVVVDMPNMQFDVDNPEDLQQLMDGGLLYNDTETGRYIDQLGQLKPEGSSAFGLLPSESDFSAEAIQEQYVFDEVQPVNAHG